MDNTLILLNGTSINAREALIALGALSFALMLLALRLRQGRSVLPVLIALPFGAAASLYLGRFIQWYCLSESYTSLCAAMSDLRTGGFSLVGAFAAVIGCAWLLRLIGAEKDTRALLDDLALSGALGIAAGRLGERFGSADRGKILIENEALQRLPFSAVVIHPVSGEAEWRFAAFCAQSLWALFLFLMLAARTIRLSRREPELREREKGGGFLLFLTLYCEGQILLDSTRYDALFLRSNGFVSMEQILSLTVLTAVMVLLTVRGVRAGAAKRGYILSWVLFLCGFGLAGYMEYYVQRHGGRFLLSYALMAVGLAVVFAATRLAAAGARKMSSAA